MTKGDPKFVTLWAVLLNFPENNKENSFMVEQKNGETNPRLYKTHEDAAEIKRRMIRSGYGKYNYKIAAISFYLDEEG